MRTLLTMLNAMVKHQTPWQQFPLIALQSIPLMSMGQFGHPCWLDARQTVINIGDMSVSKPVHFMLWADPARDDWQSPS
jgi:hypothetical protein